MMAQIHGYNRSASTRAANYRRARSARQTVRLAIFYFSAASSAVRNSFDSRAELVRRRTWALAPDRPYFAGAGAKALTFFSALFGTTKVVP